jgi:hypothetical protein
VILIQSVLEAQSLRVFAVSPQEQSRMYFRNVTLAVLLDVRLLFASSLAQSNGPPEAIF